MCGIAGFFSAHLEDEAGNIGRRMAQALTHRGPDDEGIWTDEAAGLTLAHRRLSILDLTSAGHQPMRSTCGRYVIAFNGEIYNHLTLRARLVQEGYLLPWRGHSDTETLLVCFSVWGVEKTLEATVGMFAIALWDAHSKVLTLARDRMGEKPLYWGWQDGTLMFGSELKALKAHPHFKGEIDRNALALLLRHGFIATPHSIYRGIHKLRPGHFIHIPLSAIGAAPPALSHPYWEMNNAVRDGLNHPFDGTPEEAASALERQLMESIGAQMLADVPLGAFLSGGIDSSIIVALMQAQSPRPIQTFTIGFDDRRYDEAQYALAVARHLGTHHTELYVRPEDALSVIDLLPGIYDEPFADSSQIPTFLVSRLARRHVTVALSGDAGDELFGGYGTYQFAPAIWNKISRLPAPLRKAAAAALASLSISSWNAAFTPMRPWLPNRLHGAMSGERLHKLAQLLPSKTAQAFYLQLSSHWTDPERMVIGSCEPATLLDMPEAWPEVDSFEHWMMAMSAQTYMTDDILVKVDRAAMANGLEVRVPMLDHRIVELAWRMPLDLKIRGGTGKWLLRQVLQRYVPRELIERPKMGFSLPLAAWLRGPLREWAETLLDGGRLKHEGYFDSAAVQWAWKMHLSGRCDYSSRLWCVLMFQAWLEKEKASLEPALL